MIRLLILAGAAIITSTIAYFLLGSGPASIEIPVQPTMIPTAATPIEPAIELRQLSRELNASGIALKNPDALATLPHTTLNRFMQAALHNPGAFFTGEFKASSLGVAAAWINRHPGSRRMAKKFACSCAGPSRQSQTLSNHANGQPADSTTASSPIPPTHRPPSASNNPAKNLFEHIASTCATHTHHRT